MRKYCVQVKRELEDDHIFHFDWWEDGEPTNEQVETRVMQEDINYKPDYESFKFWKV